MWSRQRSGRKGWRSLACGTPGGCRSRRSPVAKTPSPRELERSSDALLVSGGIIAHLRPLPQTRKGVEGIVDGKPANGLLRKPVGQGVLAVEMPVRVIGREQQHAVAADMLERARQDLLLTRPDVDQLDRHA